MSPNIQQPGVPNPEDKIDWQESKGALLLFFPTALETGIKTANGEADAIRAKVVRLNDGRVYGDALIFPKALVSSLRGAVPDGIVLGTLDQGQNTKGNPPWILKPYSAEELAQAEAWIAANPANPVQQPQGQAPAPAWGATAPAAPAAAWGQQPAAPAAGGWGAPAPAAAPAAPAWSAQPDAPQAPAAPAWGSPAAPPVSTVHPGLVEALRKKGIAVPPGATQESAEGIWAMAQHQPDVTA